MRVNKIYSGMNVMQYKYLQAFHKTLIKRYIAGQTIAELQQKIRQYNDNFLKSKGMYLFYDDLTIEKINNNEYYLLLNGNEFNYFINSNQLKEAQK